MFKMIQKTLFKSITLGGLSLVFLISSASGAWAAECAEGEAVTYDSSGLIPSCMCTNGMTVTDGACTTSSFRPSGVIIASNSEPVVNVEDLYQYLPTQETTNNTNSPVDFTTTVTKEDFDLFNPLLQGEVVDGVDQAQNARDLSTPGGIISRLLEYLFPLAGMVLFVMFTWSGFEMIYGASNGSKSIEAGKNRLTTSIIGFILLFSSYWIIQILEVILGITVF